MASRERATDGLHAPADITPGLGRETGLDDAAGPTGGAAAAAAGRATAPARAPAALLPPPPLAAPPACARGEPGGLTWDQALAQYVGDFGCGQVRW
jgi:hypothetical protein